ncbi:MAG: hypothetical protein GJ680_02445 [Alteromonadaceae bacterium]|nr:hypothetical protein [Alteromonadaceae bacterium]
MQLNLLSHETIIDIAKPMWDNLIAASNARDYERFILHFSKAMGQEATRENIEAQWENQPVLSSLIKEPELMGCLKGKDAVRVLWKQMSTSTNDELIGYLTLVVEGGEMKINGAQIF